MNIFDKLNYWVNSTEGSLVNFLTAFAPWLAPIIPAYMTYHHMIEFLGFPEVIAFIAALIVEILGFGTVSTFLDFWFYNRRERAGSKKAPIWLVVISFVFYLTLIIFSNVIIDIAQAFGNIDQQNWATVWVRTLLTLQTIPAVLIVAARTSHKNLINEMKKEKLERTENRESELSKKVPTNNNSSENNMESSKKPEDWRKVRPNLTLDQLKELANLRPDQIKAHAERIGYTYKTLANWRSRARAELNIQDEEEIPEQPKQESGDGWD